MLNQININNKSFHYIGAFCLFIASIFSIGFHHVDEHFQILEFASYKLGLTSDTQLPWEFAHKMRPTIQPAMVVATYNFSSFLGFDNPFIVAFLLRLFSALISFTSIYLLYKVFVNSITNDKLKTWYAILTFTLWFAVYNGVRFSSENWSGSLFIIGFSYYFLSQNKTALTYISIGTLLGLCFIFRFQSAFLIFGFSLWLLFIQKEKFLHLLYIGFGFMLMFGLGLCVDRWFYEEWLFTSWNYFAQNILENKASNFGTQPWWWYFANSLISCVPPISVLIVISVIINIIYKPKTAVVWSIFPFILIHCIIGHKEPRFLFPITTFLPILMINAIEIIQNQFIKNFVESSLLKIFMRLSMIVNTILLIYVMFMPADTQMLLLKKLYNSCQTPTTVYFVEKNPYIRVGLDICFYKPKELKVIPIKSINDIPAGENQLIVLTQPDKTSNPKLGRPIYSTFPDWVSNFNFNNWLDRTTNWHIYEIKK